MPNISEADRYLLQQIAAGNADGWSQLVARYQGRLLAFARGRLAKRDDAEDLVQDTFIAFLENLSRFRENASIETYLFTILRRKLIDVFRGSKFRACSLSDTDDDDSSSAAEMLPGHELSASRYAADTEDQSKLRIALTEGLSALVSRLQANASFRDLQILEMLFYAHIRNKTVAQKLKMDEKQVALIKHRSLNEIRSAVMASNVIRGGKLFDSDWETSAGAVSLLSEVWEESRPTCPKRSTVGRWVIGTVEPQWKHYIDFHINQLGCRFCKANLDDLQKQTAVEPDALRRRVLQSTVGFFKRVQN